MNPVITIHADVHAAVPQELQVELANVTECLRVIGAIAAEAYEADDGEIDDDLPHDEDVLALRLHAELFASIFQETYGQPPSIPARVFTTLRTYTNRHPENRPGSEACLFAAMLACRHLDKALVLPNASDTKTYDDLDDLLFACHAALQWFVSIVDGNLAGILFTDEANGILDAILAGGTLPPFVTQEEFAEQRRKAKEWHEREKSFRDDSLRRQIRILHALKDEPLRDLAWIAERVGRVGDDALGRDLRLLEDACNLEREGDLYRVADDVFVKDWDSCGATALSA